MRPTRSEVSKARIAVGIRNSNLLSKTEERKRVKAEKRLRDPRRLPVAFVYEKKPRWHYFLLSRTERIEFRAEEEKELKKKSTKACKKSERSTFSPSKLKRLRRLAATVA